MKTIFSTTIAILISQFLTAQTSVSGTVRDENWEPLPFISVQLLDASSNLLVQKTTTDGYGQFVFERADAGQYVVKASFAVLGEVLSPKTKVADRPVTLPDLKFPKNAAATTKKTAFTGQPIEQLEAGESGLAKN